MSTTVPREKVVAIAENVRELHDLAKQQKVTQAKLIRWCVMALKQTEAQARRSLEAERVREQRAGKRYRPVGFHEPSKKVREDKALALLYLEWLATQLEDQSVRDPDSI